MFSKRRLKITYFQNPGILRIPLPQSSVGPSQAARSATGSSAKWKKNSSSAWQLRCPCEGRSSRSFQKIGRVYRIGVPGLGPKEKAHRQALKQKIFKERKPLCLRLPSSKPVHWLRRLEPFRIPRLACPPDAGVHGPLKYDA